MNKQDQNLSNTKEKSNNILSRTTTVAFVGPLPPPEILKKYDEIVPGAAERIITMAEEQSKHRRLLESKVINSDIERAQLGLWFGLMIGLTGLIFGFILAIKGYLVSGTILGGGTLVALVGVFIHGSNTRSRERKQRREEDR